MNRREFMKTGAGAAAWAAAPGLLRGAASGGGGSRIPLGFLGVTHSHALEKLRLALASPDWEVVGVCEESAAGRADAVKLGARAIGQDELLRRAHVVAVESEVRDHARHALLALRAGRHVHVEKPPATTLAEMEQMVALARERKLLLQGGYMWRYHQGFNTIFEAVRQGWLGQVFLVRAYISNHLAPARRPEWGEFKGGALFELGSHLIDAIVRLLGRPKSVTPFLRRHGGLADNLNDNNVAVLDYDKAVAVLINTALQATTKPARSFEVQGANGCAVLAPLEPPALAIELAEAAGPYQRGLQIVPLPLFKRYEADLIELAAAVRGQRSLSVGLDQELLVQETLLRASGMR